MTVRLTITLFFPCEPQVIIMKLAPSVEVALSQLLIHLCIICSDHIVVIVGCKSWDAHTQLFLSINPNTISSAFVILHTHLFGGLTTMCVIIRSLLVRLMSIIFDVFSMWSDREGDLFLALAARTNNCSRNHASTLCLNHNHYHCFTQDGHTHTHRSVIVITIGFEFAPTFCPLST